MPLGDSLTADYRIVVESDVRSFEAKCQGLLNQDFLTESELRIVQVGQFPLYIREFYKTKVSDTQPPATQSVEETSAPWEHGHKKGGRK